MKMKMKKLIYFAAFFLALMSCDNEREAAPKQEVEMTEADSIQKYSGNFISVGNKAVLKGDKFIFEVKMDSLATVLKTSSSEYKLKDPNVIPVEVRGKVTDNPINSGFSQVIQIKEILEIIAGKNSEEKQTEE
mgnify:FL=1